jgi:uncharacterized OB-fold protein
MSVGPVVRDEPTAAFFDGTAAGQFLLRYCPAGHFSEPAAAQCTQCGSTELSWQPAAGLARLVSWTVSYGKAADGEPPPRSVLVIGELDEGPWWWSQLAGFEPAAAGQLAAGERLRIEFHRADDEHEAVPVFVLAER